MLTKTGGSILLAHNPPKWVNFACRFTPVVSLTACCGLPPPLPRSFQHKAGQPGYPRKRSTPEGPRLDRWTDYDDPAQAGSGRDGRHGTSSKGGAGVQARGEGRLADRSLKRGSSGREVQGENPRPNEQREAAHRNAGSVLTSKFSRKFGVAVRRSRAIPMKTIIPIRSYNKIWRTHVPVRLKDHVLHLHS